MKKLRFLFLLYSIILFGNLRAADTVFVKEAQIPVLLERQDNILFYIRLETDTAQIFNDVSSTIYGKHFVAEYSVCKTLL